MAHFVILERNGRFTCQVRVRQRGKLVHSEARTFSTPRIARDWGAGRVAALRDPAALKAAIHRGDTVGHLLHRYSAEFGAMSRFGRNKRAQIDALQRQPIAEIIADKLTSAEIITHAKARRLGGAGPATVMNDLVWLRVVMKAARVAWGAAINLQAIEDAVHWLRTQGIIGRPRQRDRLPTADELRRLSDYFKVRDQRSIVPMHDIMWFAIHSTRREGEITRLLWTDNSARDHTGMVRDLKHPRKKEGNNRRFKYTREAWKIVQRQPRVSECIFPYNPRTISAYFTRACHVLEIPDLDFHDLRHEATTRLFEAGYSIVEVAQFSLHESWQDLKRYTHLRPGKVKHR